MPNLFSYMSEWVGPAYIETLEQAGGVLYFGGSFSLYMGMVSGSQLGRYDGAPDAVSPIGAFDNPVMDLAVRQPYELIAGGSFAANSGLSVPHIASTDLALNVPTINASNARLRVWPNPASDFLHIELGAPLSQNTIIDVIDASGRIVITTSVRSSNKDLDVRAIQAGAYTVRIRDGNTIRIAPFVKH